MPNRHIASFHGLDANRNPSINIDYGIGTRATNLGRSMRRPLEARLGGRPVTTTNATAELGGPVYAMGAMLQGGRFHLILRTAGGKLVAALDVKPKSYV